MKNKVKIIFHIDMNAFFISCELINHPELRNKPLAISGRGAIYNKGVIVTASYEARKFGVKAAMPVFQAKTLCPNLTIITSNMGLYQEYSHKFIEFLKLYTNLYEIASIDEAYLDMTERCKTTHPYLLAQEIQNILYEEYQLPCSIGISINKFLAKMASEMKKPLGITILRKRDLPQLLWPLPISDMFGIGKKTAPKLIDNNIFSIGDIIKSENKKILMEILGNQYEYFYQAALGNSSNIIEPSRNDELKSIGNSNTFNALVLTEKDAYLKLKKLSNTVIKRIINHNYLAKTVSITIKYADFSSHSKSKTLKNHTDDLDTVFSVCCDLFDEVWKHKPIRLLGVSCSGLMEKKKLQEQVDLFNYDNFHEEEKIIKIMNEINRKFGDNTIKKGNKQKSKE